ncbi:MAG: acylneuraminate cytidylyltransferase family protein [Bdellovibrionales bacterium]|nr:acylneuraminate cytidylyltransferase family protein [Bdellovibrionales bacterium]
MIAAIIPARGNSKGIPRKNLIDFCGRPLLAWSIEQALQSESVDHVFVSSDSEEILSVAETYGAKPILRPPELASDTATSESAWLHAVDTIEEGFGKMEYVIGMQPTSPVRESADLDKAVIFTRENGYDSVFSGSEIADFCIWTGGSELKSLTYDYLNRKRRQEFGVQYLENGSFYVFRPQVLREKNNRLGGKIGVFTMPIWKSFEVDDLEGLEFLKVIMKGYLL